MVQKVWRIIPSSPHACRLAQETGISNLKAQLLINRGITTAEKASLFLNPRLADLSNPMLLKDMDIAVDHILYAIKNSEPIAVFGDYDADGITATALVQNFFSDLGIPVFHYIPNRIDEGYSLNLPALRQLASKGVKLIITVDCGISNTKEIEQAEKMGIRIIVTDHHQIPDDFDPLCPVINPNRKDSSFPFRDLAGVGVAFFLIAAIRAKMRETGWFKNNGEPDLRSYLDLVALGTVADMVPLTGHNRILVLSGLEVMKDSKWPGIRAMKYISAIDNSTLSSADVAFRLGPRLNAAGRVGDSSTGITTLTTRDNDIARKGAEALNSMNSERQHKEGLIFRQIEDTIIPDMDFDRQRTIVLARPDWHIGVLGIVASRLLERYHRPTLLLTIRDGLAVGSGRSIDGFNLHSSMTRLGHLFEKFGGHYHAAGCTLKVENIEKMAEGMEAIALETLKKDDLIPTINIDAEIDIDDLTYDTVTAIRSLEPFGAGNPEPLLYSGNLEVIDSRIVGSRHLKLKVKNGSSVHDAIGFNMSEKRPEPGRIIKMVYTPEINRWNGTERVQLRVTDLRLN